MTGLHPLILITGASSGIGASVAYRFAKGNYRLALVARRLDRLKQIQEEIGVPCISFELDICDREKVSRTIESIEEEHGPIEVLINNAGAAFGLDPAQEAKLNDWDRCIDVNISGLLYCTRAVLPRMVRENKGHIINLGSVAGSYPYPGANVYGATKAFVHQFSLNLRADLLGTKVRVSCIEPGLVGGTEFSEIRFQGDREKAKKIYEGASALSPDDIAEVIYFCHCLPSHVNINTVELMPVSQASAPLAVFRKSM